MEITFPCICNGGSLPDRPLVDGYSESYPDNVIRNTMDSGPSKQRIRYTSVSTNITCKFSLDPTQKADLFAFYKSDTKYGSELFEWIDFTDGNTAYYRFSAPPEVSSVEADNWYITLKLEKMP